MQATVAGYRFRIILCAFYATPIGMRCRTEGRIDSWLEKMFARPETVQLASFDQ
jgi:hypothetical protein